jgi:hypothetical protein
MENMSTMQPLNVGNQKIPNIEPVSKPMVSEKLKNKASSLTSLTKLKKDSMKFKTSEQALGEIYKMMVEMEENRKLQREQQKNHLNEEDEENERHNKELIKALTGRRKVQTKKPTKAKKEKKVEKETEAKTVEPKKEEPKSVEKKTTEVPAKPAEVTKPTTRPVETPKPTSPIIPPLATTAIGVTSILAGKEALASNIAKYESKGSSGKSFGGNEYNAYNKGTVGNKMIPADKPIDFSKMTIEEYLRRGRLKSGDPEKIFAVGRYQIIPDTMDSLVKKLKIDPKITTLDPATQDALFSKGLIGTKRKKVEDYITGKSDDKDAAILELAQEFASIGVPYDMTVNKKNLKKGESYYSGIGGNKAHNSPEEVGIALDTDRKNYLQKNKTTDIPPKTGTQIQESSKEHQQLNMQGDFSANKNKTVINNMQTVVSSTSHTPDQLDTRDDRPAILRKA